MVMHFLSGAIRPSYHSPVCDPSFHKDVGGSAREHLIWNDYHQNHFTKWQRGHIKLVIGFLVLVKLCFRTFSMSYSSRKSSQTTLIYLQTFRDAKYLV